MISVALLFLGPLYGGGAVLIREVVRRRGWGYPSVLILALAYAVLEEGITTQSLFNPNYADLRLLDPGQFRASAGQDIGVVVAIVALVALAAWVGGRTPRRTAGTVPSAWLIGLSGLVLSSAWMLVDDLVHNGWLESGLPAAIDVLAVLLLVTWSRRTGWTQLHSLALAGGALLTYAWHSFPEAPVIDASHTVDLVGNAVFSLLAVGLLVGATIRREKLGHS